jgi:AcrR family transcriptional regulator
MDSSDQTLAGPAGRSGERHAERQDKILDAAFHAFATYGFRRTTMDDIARATGLSRPALYQHYRNKEDLFRSLATRYFDQVLADMEAVLAEPGRDPAEQLTAAFVAKDGKFMDAVLGTPHGSELLDAGFRVTGDIAHAGERRMVALLTGWLERMSPPGSLGRPDELAETIVAALTGLKTTARDLAGYRARQARLAGLVAAALPRPARL